MPLAKVVSIMKNSRILSIDPASHSLAWSIIDLHKGKLTLVAYGKIEYGDLPETSKKFQKIKDELPEICKTYTPKTAVIEQSVFIQNFQASRILSYIIGAAWSELIDHCSIVEDVNPLKWKSGIGYKNVNKLEVSKIKKEFGERGIQKRLVDERKNRVKAILAKNFDGVDFQDMDSDITDAIGIGLWYAVSNGDGTLQR